MGIAPGVDVSSFLCGLLAVQKMEAERVGQLDVLGNYLTTDQMEINLDSREFRKLDETYYVTLEDVEQTTRGAPMLSTLTLQTQRPWINGNNRSNPKPNIDDAVLAEWLMQEFASSCF